MKLKIIKADTSTEVILTSKGGMFDVTNLSMEANIGKQVEYKNPTCSVEKEIFMIGGIQKNYAGKIVYRLFNDNDQFGRPAEQSKLNFIYKGIKMLYALKLKGTGKLLGFDVESNNGADFCVSTSYELSEYSDRIWTTSSEANAIAVANSTSEYYNADYDSLINKYIGRIEVVALTIGNLIKN